MSGSRSEGRASRSNIRLRGLDGGFKGVEQEVRLGETITVGRSRTCEFFPRIQNGGITTQAEVIRLRRMSRQHCRISYCNAHHVEIEDLSRNGTLLNGQRIHRIVLDDLAARPVTLELAGLRVILELDQAEMEG